MHGRHLLDGQREEQERRRSPRRRLKQRGQEKQDGQVVELALHGRGPDQHRVGGNQRGRGPGPNDPRLAGEAEDESRQREVAERKQGARQPGHREAGRPRGAVENRHGPGPHGRVVVPVCALVERLALAQQVRDDPVRLEIDGGRRGPGQDEASRHAERDDRDAGGNGAARRALLHSVTGTEPGSARRAAGRRRERQPRRERGRRRTAAPSSCCPGARQ